MLQTVLKVIEGKHTGKTIPVNTENFIVGREHDCQLRPNSETISRHHCVFKTDEYTVRLRDLGSTNGTFVNGERISSGTVLKDGDSIHIGKLAFEISIQPAVKESSETATIEAHETAVQIPPIVPAPSALDDSSIHNPNVGGGTTIIAAVPNMPTEGTPAQGIPTHPQQQMMPPQMVPGQPYPQQPMPEYPVAGQIPYPPQQYPYPQQPGIAYPQQQQVTPQQPIPVQEPAAEVTPPVGNIPAPPIKLPPPPGAEDAPLAGE